MSSMGRKTVLTLALMAGSALAFPAMAQAQDGARSEMVAQQPGRMDQAVTQWEYLTSQDELPFAPYASFLTTYPDFPKQQLLQRRAEAALDRDAPSPQALVAFFDRYPPLTNSAKARYALALASLDRPEALETARAAWRGGTMSGPAELYMQGSVRQSLRPRRSRCAHGRAAVAGQLRSRLAPYFARVACLPRDGAGAARAAAGEHAFAGRSDRARRCDERCGLCLQSDTALPQFGPAL